MCVCVYDEIKGSKQSDNYQGLCVCVCDETGQSGVTTIMASVCVCMCVCVCVCVMI